MEPEGNHLRAILDTAVDGIITINSRGIIRSANPAAESIFGYRQDELVGHNINMLMPSPDHEQHDTYLRDYLRTGNAKIIGIGREVEGLRKDGSRFPMDLAVSEWSNAGERFFTGIVRDITERRRYQQQLAQLNEQLEERVVERTRQLEQAQRELIKNERLATLGKISGGISHEIRNPLNAIKTSVYFLLHAQNLSPEKTKEHLRRIDRQVTLADEVVTSLVDFARLPLPTLSPIQLQPWIEESLASIQLADNHRLLVSIPEELPAVYADGSQLRVALLNLIRNARDAMPSGGQITITASQDESNQEIAVLVADTGVGIAQEDIDRVLEPLYTTKPRGMGLGLPITHAIVERSGGHLTVESERGKGSVFGIHLPSSPPTTGNEHR